MINHVTPEMVKAFMENEWVKEHIVVDTTFYTPPRYPAAKTSKDKGRNGV